MATPTTGRQWFGRSKEKDLGYAIWHCGEEDWQKGMEKAKRISQESIDTMYALSSLFIDNSIHCAVWVTNLNSLAQLDHHHHSLLLLRYLRRNFPWCRSLWSRQDQELANRIHRSSPPERTQCGQGNMGRGIYHCSVRGACSTMKLLPYRCE